LGEICGKILISLKIIDFRQQKNKEKERDLTHNLEISLMFFIVLQWESSVRRSEVVVNLKMPPRHDKREREREE
jgi:hypothetical protein